MAKASPQPNRFHGLDALRGALIVLVVVYHALGILHTSGKGFPEPGSWIATLLWAIRTFNMPAFFLLSGFFAQFVVEQKGLGYFFQGRVRRILLPLLILFPLITVPEYFFVRFSALLHSGEVQSLVELKEVTVKLLGKYFREFRPGSLWFLIYLFSFAATHCVGTALAGKFAATKRLSVFFRLPFLFGLALLCLGLMEEPGTINAPFSPDWGAALLAWLYFFSYYLAGCAIHRLSSRISLEKFFPLRIWLPLVVVIGIVLFAFPAAGWLKAALALGFSAAMISFLMALFLRFFNGPSAAFRYVSDGSYWLYLVHETFLTATDSLLVLVTSAFWPRFFLTLAASLALSLASYHWLVRSTWIGQGLNGFRHKKT